MERKESWEVITEKVKKGEIFEDPEILAMSDPLGNTIAHYQAERGWTTEDKEVLKWSNRFLETVAHIQAKRGWEPRGENVENILGLRDIFGISVLEVVKNYRWHKLCQDGVKKGIGKFLEEMRSNPIRLFPEY